MTVPKEGTASYDHYAAQIVNFLVQEQIVAQSAKELGVQVTDKEVNDQLAQLEKAYGGEAKVLALLKSQGMTLDLLKRSIRSQTLSTRAAAIVTKKATVSDAEIQAYWNAHKAAARQGRRRRRRWPRPRRPSSRRCSRPSSSSCGPPGSPSGPRPSGSRTRVATTPPR